MTNFASDRVKSRFSRKGDTPELTRAFPSVCDLVKIKLTDYGKVSSRRLVSYRTYRQNFMFVGQIVGDETYPVPSHSNK